MTWGGREGGREGGEGGRVEKTLLEEVKNGGNGKEKRREGGREGEKERGREGGP